MKKLLLLSLAIILTSCDYFSVEKKKPKFANFKKNKIEFNENTIILTHAYRNTTPDEFRGLLDSLGSKPKFKKVALQELEKIEKKKVDFKLFVDERNIENYIFAYACDFYQLDEHRAATVVDALSKEVKKESNKQDVQYQRIHGRFFFTPTSKIVKLKYLKSYKENRKYQAEYIVASKSGGGMGLLISNLENIDFERSIKRLAVN